MVGAISSHDVEFYYDFSRQTFFFLILLQVEIFLMLTTCFICICLCNKCMCFGIVTKYTHMRYRYVHVCIGNVCASKCYELRHRLSRYEPPSPVILNDAPLQFQFIFGQNKRANVWQSQMFTNPNCI
jgi:hypothetical protein